MIMANILNAKIHLCSGVILGIGTVFLAKKCKLACSQRRTKSAAGKLGPTTDV
tara:strand:- start:314 stop:472 length:159 start_codon:yes stop_codon:yes gene_type:complete